jgi:hypothetical protein
MSLPKKEEKAYLKITESGEGHTILAKPEDGDALAALFLQYGMSCERRRDREPGQDALVLPPGMNRAQAETLLDGYKNAKGS